MDASLAISRARKRYVLAVLTLVYTFSIADQGLITLLLEPIKADLHLSDTQLGFLAGIAFGVIYALMGLPIARWADRGDRNTIASMMIGLWGAGVTLCLFVSGFTQLVVARIATAVGGAGCMPPTYSLVGDYFPAAAERTRAITLYMMANPLSLLVSFILGGMLDDRFGWRITFFAMGIPALLLAVLVRLTIFEPRTKAKYIHGSVAQLPRLSKVLTTLRHQRSTRHLVFALVIIYTMGLGLAPWYGAFMVRCHGMGTVELGFWFGLIFGVCGIAGVLFGGYVAGRWFAEDEQGQMRIVAATTVSLAPWLALFLVLPDKIYALVALVPFVVAANFLFGPIFALLQRLVVDEMRATTVAVVMLLCNLIGMGIGPQVVGILSDALKTFGGSDSLRYAMLTMSLLALWAAYHFWQVGETVRMDLETVARRAGSDSSPIRPFELIRPTPD